jgi:hypothetical protein
MRNLTLIALFASLTLWGCGQAEAPSTPEPTEAQTVDVVVEEPTEAPMVDVAVGGTEFDPPVEVAQLPEGVWYCDMGTVHYAALEPGECPLCGMTLVEHGPDMPMDDGHGEEHGEHGEAG